MERNTSVSNGIATRIVKDRPIYLDYQASTPCDPRVVEKMLPYFTEYFGNPHSSQHIYGREAKVAIEEARTKVAKIINADLDEIIFTSGATEANNLAIKGVAYFYREKKNHIITCVTEHKCVLESCRQLERDGFTITYLPVKSNGLIDLKTLEEAITNKTVLVSIMAVNNEIGVIQPIKEIGKICHERGVFFHTDAAQAVGKISLDVVDMNIDLMSISGHKVYGPKGVGAIYISNRSGVRIRPLFSGGGQEKGIRSGTLPTPLCVGLGEACALAQKEMAAESARIRRLKNRFYTGLMNRLPGIHYNGDSNHQIAGNINLSFSYVEGESLMLGLKRLCVSSGSACTSESLRPSYVLEALGVDEELIHTSLRIGIGRFTTEKDIDTAIEDFVATVERLREMSALWEMVQDGIDLKSINWGMVH